MVNLKIETFAPEEYTKQYGDVVYGELMKTSYYSTTCERDRNLNVLLPAGYDKAKKYPLFVFLHGIFEDENTMTRYSTVIGNLMAKGLMKEAVVVFPFMFASKTKAQCDGFTPENIEDYNRFFEDLIVDLLPFIKENYSIAEGRKNTAIAGFSLGGRQSLAIGLLHQEVFGYVGAFSPAPGLVPAKDWAMEHPGLFAEEEVVFAKEKPYFLMVCCGDSDKVVGQFPASYHALFEKNGVEHAWWEIPGSDHGDPAIVSGVYNFCCRIFQ